MRLLLLCCLVYCLTTSFVICRHDRRTEESSRSMVETPDTSTETPDSSTETPETPDTPDSTQETPETPETPDSKAKVPNSSHNSGIDVSQDESGSGHEDHPGHEYGNSPVLGKKIRKLKRQHEKIEEGTKKSTRAKNQKLNSHQGTKKQLLGYPEPDGREATAYGDFGQGGPPAPGYGGLGKGGLGTEIEGIPVGMGAGGEPLGFREQEGPLPGQNFHIPGIAGPSNYDENAEVGRGNDDGNGDLSRYSDKDDIDSLAQRAVAHYDGYDNEDSPFNRDSLQQIEPDESVTKAIGRPFDPMGQSNNMDEHEDSPFQNIKQESPFQVPMRNIADQASFAESQMQQFRPESAGEPLGPQQEETPYQPQNEEEAEAPGYGEQEGENFQATGMNGAEAVLGLNEQEGMKRHKTKMAGKKTLTSAVKRKRISNKAQLKKNHH